MENKSPLVTIVVISYNQAKYIEENLNSIKTQTYQNIELIVADDASTDNSLEVFDTWLKQNNYTAKKNYHTKNTGLATVLNECIEMATGKYIKLIAADDYLHHESIEKCVNRLEELGEEYGMVFTDTFAINDVSKRIEDIADYNSLGNIDPLVFKKNLLNSNQIAALTVVMRLDVVKDTGKYDSKFIIEDYYRWLKINQKYFIAYIPEKLAYYRQHDNNISKLKADRIEQENIILKIMFDGNGSAKDIVNYKMLINYLNNSKFDTELKTLYNNYPFKVKRLDIAIRNKLPVNLFKLISKFY